MERVLAILGSARSGGNTAMAADRLRRGLGLGEGQLVDLLSCRIEPFRYQSRGEDDFPMIVERMAGHQHVIFATPVYWYAMSGLMKLFFDRLSDLLVAAEGRLMGRSLAGRDVWLLATGTDETLPAGFHEPFALTADYFSMRWRGAFYIHVNKDASPAEQDFTPVDELVAALTRGL